MGFTYTAANISEHGLDYARFLLGDTDSETHVLEDEEISALLSMHVFNEAVAQCADSMVSKISQTPNRYKDEAGLESGWSDERIKSLRDLAKRLRSGIVQTEAVQVVVSGPVAGITTGPDMSGFNY